MDNIPPHDEIVDEIEQFEREYPDHDEFIDIVASYAQQLAEEASFCVKRSEAKVKTQEPETESAIAIEVYDLLIDAYSNTVGSAPKQVAYKIATGLLRNYDFFLKEK